MKVPKLLTTIGLASVLFTIQITVKMKSSLAGPIGPDMGYQTLPNWMVDVNGDRKPDFCRFVGSNPNIWLSCQLATNDGFDTNQFTFNSRPGFDRGYDTMPRSMQDVNDDGRADFCRWVGDFPNIYESCLLAGQRGFRGEYNLN